MTTLNGVAVSTELFKIKRDVKDPPEDVKHSGSDHPRRISAPSFRTAPPWVVGRRFLNHSNIEAAPNKRQFGDSPRKTKTTKIRSRTLKHANSYWQGYHYPYKRMYNRGKAATTIYMLGQYQFRSTFGQLLPGWNNSAKTVHHNGYTPFRVW